MNYEECGSNMEIAVTKRMLHEFSYYFPEEADLDRIQATLGIRLLPYKVKNPVEFANDILQPERFHKTKPYRDFIEYNAEQPTALVFSFLKHNLYALVPYTDACLDVSGVVVVLDKNVCLLKFKDYLKTFGFDRGVNS